MRHYFLSFSLIFTMLLWPSSAFTDSQQTLSDYLYPHLLAGSPRIDLPANTPYSDVAPAMNTLLRDRPELFHVGQSYTVGYVQHEPDVATYITPTYRMDIAQADLLRDELYAIARDLAARHPDPEDLHDALLDRVTYGGDTDMRHTAVGALIDGQATCEGYAQALTLLYRTAGIPCQMVTGTATDASGVPQAHAWNIADLDGLAFIDATWNDQDRLGLNTHWYYGLSTVQMARTHTPDPSFALPECGDQANWHRVRGLYVGDRAGMYAAVYHVVRTGEPINVRVTDEALYRAFAEDTAAFLDAYDRDVLPDDAFYGAYSVVADDRQMCILFGRAE